MNLKQAQEKFEHSVNKTIRTLKGIKKEGEEKKELISILEACKDLVDNINKEKKFRSIFNDKIKDSKVLKKVKEILGLKKLKFSFEELEMLQYHINLKNKKLGKEVSKILDRLYMYLPEEDKSFSFGKALGVAGIFFLGICLSALIGLPIIPFVSTFVKVFAWIIVIATLLSSIISLISFIEGTKIDASSLISPLILALAPLLATAIIWEDK